MNKTEHLLTCLAEEGVEIALELSKQSCKSLRFGLHDVNVLEPKGPTNQERLIDELNDLHGVIELLIEVGALPADWHDRKKVDAKKEKVCKFMDYAKEGKYVLYTRPPFKGEKP